MKLWPHRIRRIPALLIPPSLLHCPGLSSCQTPGEILRARVPRRLPAESHTNTHETTGSGAPPAEGQIRSPQERAGFGGRGGILQPARGSRCFPSHVIRLPLLLHFARLHSRLFSSQRSGLAGGVSHPIPPSLRRRASEEPPGEGRSCCRRGVRALPGDARCAQGALPGFRGMQAPSRELSQLPEGCGLCTSCCPGFRGMQALPRLLSQLPEGCRLCSGCSPWL